MSIMSFLEAVESVLMNEMERRDDLMILRPGARRVLDESEREIALPRLGDASFSIALGAAMTGMHPVLDLRHEEDPVSLLIDALCDQPCASSAAITLIVDVADADALLEFPNLRVFHPKTPRQAAGLLRSALRAQGLSLFIADIELSDLTDDVPDDPEFILLPLDDAEEDDSEESMPEIPEESIEDMPPEDIPDESFPEEIVSAETDGYDLPDEPVCPPAPLPDEACAPQPPIPFLPAILSMRQIPCDLSRLNALSEDLGAPQGLIEKYCMDRLQPQDAFCWQQDASALPGECAFLPPVGKPACLWLGCDMLCIAYDAARLSHADAASLLRSARRLLEKPSLLIYDRERELS